MATVTKSMTQMDFNKMALKECQYMLNTTNRKAKAIAEHFYEEVTTGNIFTKHPKLTVEEACKYMRKVWDTILSIEFQ